MGILHYLNVKQGDCSIIQHPSGHTTVIDVCNASELPVESIERDVTVSVEKSMREGKRGLGNYNQKSLPVNPIAYLTSFNITGIFRFVVTNPDMDHMDGIKDLFEEFSPINFWDTENQKEFPNFDSTVYREEDWLFYKNLRDSDPSTDPKRLTLYSGVRGQYYNQDEDGSGGGDGLYILSPTSELIEDAIESGDYNDASYVILYRSNGGRILFSGDSHDKTWAHILENHREDVQNIDLLIAPHHGRDSDRSYEFLNVVNPRLTFFGNAPSNDLGYAAWNSRNLPIITNNQANCMVVNTNVNPMELYVTNEVYAEKLNSATFYEETYQAYYCFDIN